MGMISESQKELFLMATDALIPVKEELPEAFLVAFDPGEGTGIAVLSRTGGVLGTQITRTREELYEVLELLPNVRKVVMEDYTLFQHKAIQQSGSKLETVRVIGVIESWAHQRKAEVILQRPNILPIAKLWTGIKPKGAHRNNHHISALLHGLYYLQKEGYIVPTRR